MMRFENLIDALEAAPSECNFITFWFDEDDWDTITFGEFRQRAHAQARALQQSGLCEGHHVVILMPQSVTAMAVFVGAMMLGAVPSFLAYPNFKIEPAKYLSGLVGVLANLRARLVVIDADFPDELLEHVALGDGGALLRAADGAASPGDVLVPSPRIEGAHVAFVQHSAGTTGLQKGVTLTHAAVLRQLAHLADALQINATADSVYTWLPLYHDMGLIAGFLLPMVYHLPLVMQSPLEWVMRPQNMLHAISEHKCTLAWQPNFAFQFIARRTPVENRSRYDLSSLRALINCSEPVRAGSMDEFRDTFAGSGLRPGAMLSSYAMAENVFAATQSDPRQPEGPTRIWADHKPFRSEHMVVKADEGAPDAICFISSGRLLQNAELQILSDTGQTLAQGQVGEILLRSDCLFEGYCNRPDLTAAALVDGWYHTGDLGFVFNDELYVVGRKKDLLIVGGENIYPQDIEDIVSGHKAIHDGRAVAMGVYNPGLGTEEIIVVAEVERDELLVHATLYEQEIRTAVVQGMGVAVRTVFLMPPKWIVKSTAGKPARAATRAKLQAEHPELNFEG
jgi:acyl-CoA synthetase (AMP-forming)/AMP-acid ligase II